MKTKLTTLILIIAFGVLSFVSAKANTNEALNVSVKSSGVIVLRYTAAARVSPKVTILDANKRVVFSERISGKKGFARLYNITALPEGEYFFEVVENGVKTVKSINYKKEAVATLDSKINVVPSATTGKYELLYKGAKSGSVNVSIYSKSEGLIFEDAVETEGAFKKTYDLSKLSAGEYVFEVSSDNQVVSQEVSLEKTKLSLSK